MGLYLNPSNRMFQIMLNSKFYVDKTGIAVFMNERMLTDRRHVAVSRPRRFGKSVDADMLCAYYSRGCDSRAQFEGLEVSRHPSFEEHLNAHDVIRLDVQRMNGLSGGLDGLCETMAREIVGELGHAWPSAVGEGMPLSKALELAADAKGSGFVLVIDEWDFPLRESDDEGMRRAYLGWLRDLLKGAFCVDACYMTGILPIRKYGKHSALNLFDEFSITDPGVLAPLTGFNADEVSRLCERFDMDLGEVEHWYDGYLLGPDRIHVYNPRAVAGAMNEHVCRSFWVNTETYEALSVYIDMDFDGVQQDLVAMLDGQRVPVRVDTFENSMDVSVIRSKNDVYTLLAHLGYLGYDQVERTVFIPNEEIRREFSVAIEQGARPQLARLVRDSRELQRRTLEGDEDFVADSVGRAHASAAGPHYYNDEQALRAAVKLAFIWSIDDYWRVEELPGGRGYADVAYLPKAGSPLPPMVVELKWDKPVDAAIAQIKKRDYPAVLAGLSGECVLVGVTYREGTTEHACRIERLTL